MTLLSGQNTGTLPTTRVYTDSAAASPDWNFQQSQLAELGCVAGPSEMRVSLLSQGFVEIRVCLFSQGVMLSCYHGDSCSFAMSVISIQLF